MSEVTEQLERVIYSEIPLGRAMGVKVLSYDGNCLALQAPIEKNTNHKATAFGGSLYSLAVLTGWGWIYLKLLEQQQSAHIVIQKSEIDYLLPVTTDIVAQCQLDDTVILNKFVKTCEQKRRARIHLNVDIYQGKECAVGFRGAYVIHK